MQDVLLPIKVYTLAGYPAMIDHNIWYHKSRQPMSRVDPVSQVDRTFARLDPPFARLDPPVNLRLESEAGADLMIDLLVHVVTCVLEAA